MGTQYHAVGGIGVIVNIKATIKNHKKLYNENCEDFDEVLDILLEHDSYEHEAFGNLWNDDYNQAILISDKVLIRDIETEFNKLIQFLNDNKIVFKEKKNLRIQDYFISEMYIG